MSEPLAAELARKKKHMATMVRKAEQLAGVNPFILTKHSEIATFFEVSNASIKKWAESGMPGTHGAYDLQKIVCWERKRREGQGGPTQGSAIAAQELRIKTAIAESREHRNRINQGRYKLVDEMEQEVCRFGVQCADLLQRIPAMMAPRFPADLRDEIVEDLSKEIDSCLDAIVNYRVGDSGKVSESESELSE